MDHKKSKLDELTMAAFLLFTRSSKPRYLAGIVWALLLQHAIYLCGIQATGLWERVFREPVIFPFSFAGILFAAIWLVGTVVFMVRVRPRYNEWAAPFALFLCYWFVVTLQNTCGDTAREMEMCNFAAAMFLTCGAILATPILKNLGLIVWSKIRPHR